MQKIKHSLIQESDNSNKLDELNFDDVSEIHDLQSESEFDKTKNFLCVIAVIYAISLVILGLSLISVPTAISIYITLFVLLVASMAIALYCKKQEAHKQDDETKMFSDEEIKEIEQGYLNNTIIIFNPYFDISVSERSESNDKNLSQKLKKNIKSILQLAIYFFIFAFIGVAINLIFLQTIFIYISLAVLAIIIFSVGYKIHRINFQIKKLNDVNYYNDHSDDIVAIVKETTEKNIAIKINDKDLSLENHYDAQIKNKVSINNSVII